MLSDPTIKKSILASILASLLVIIFINPILSMFWKILLWLGPYVYEGWSNRIYRSAALGQRNWTSAVLLFLFLLIPIAFIITLLISNYLEKKETPRSRRNKLFFKIVFIISSVICIFCTIISVTAIYTDLQLNTSFEQRITVLSPVITDIERKKLRAMWAQMKNRSDYDDIVNKMEQIAKKHQIKLPPLLFN